MIKMVNKSGTLTKTASTGYHETAKARKEFISAVNGTCGPLVSWIDFDGTQAKVRQTDRDADYLHANIETLSYRLIGTGWRTTFSAVRIIDNSERYEMNVTAEYRGEWKD